MGEPKDVLQALIDELRSNLASIGTLDVGPCERGAHWGNFTVQITNGKARRTYTINVEEEGYRASS